jgi:predicted transcriptional regulator
MFNIFFTKYIPRAYNKNGGADAGMSKYGCLLLAHCFPGVSKNVKGVFTPSVLNNNIRIKIFSEIFHNPGIHMRELQRRLDVSFGTIIWHVQVLERSKMIKSAKGDYTKSYYTRDHFDTISSNGYISNSTRDRIFNYVKEIQGATQKEIGDKIGVHPSTARYHLRKLVKESLLLEIKEGKLLRYFILAG